MSATSREVAYYRENTAVTVTNQMTAQSFSWSNFRKQPQEICPAFIEQICVLHHISKISSFIKSVLIETERTGNTKYNLLFFQSLDLADSIHGHQSCNFGSTRTAPITRLIWYVQIYLKDPTILCLLKLTLADNNISRQDSKLPFSQFMILLATPIQNVLLKTLLINLYLQLPV